MTPQLSEIYLEMTFDAGHRIVDHKGKCARLHGHTYRVEVRASGMVVHPGFLADFGDIKDLINEWDHYTLLWNLDPITESIAYNPLLKEWGVLLVPFNPTAENMAYSLAVRIGDTFDLFDTQVTLWETQKANATYVHHREVSYLDK